MIRVVKYYKPMQLDPGQSEEFIVEDILEGVKFVFLPLFRLYNTPGNGTVHLEITHIFDLGWGDDPLWSGTEYFVVVDEDVIDDSMRDYNFTPQLDKDPKIITKHKVKLTNKHPTETKIYKMLVFGLTETSMQVSKDSGVITNSTT